MDLPDRGGRRKHNGDGESNCKCHKDEFRAHHAASHVHHHPADIWAAGVAIQTPSGISPTNPIATPAALFPAKSAGPRLSGAGNAGDEENARFHLNEGDTLSAMRRFACAQPFKIFLNSIGTATTGPSYSARAKSRGVPIHMTANFIA